MASTYPDGTEHSDPFANGFRQGTEPSRKFLVDLNTGLVQEHISEMERRVGKGVNNLIKHLNEFDSHTSLEHLYISSSSFHLSTEKQRGGETARTLADR